MPKLEGLSELRKRHSAGDADGPGEDEGGEGRGSGQPGRAGGPLKSSHVVEEHIDVGVPREVAYDQWTQYRDLGNYSKHESAEHKRDDRVSFTSKIGPSKRHWDAEVVEQVPGRRIAWRSVGGSRNMGVVTFHRLDDRLTRVMVQMEYHPRGAMETLGNFLRMQRRRVRKDLRLFKHHIELQGKASGKGAGEVRGKGLGEETYERLETSSGRSKASGPGARKAS